MGAQAQPNAGTTEEKLSGVVFTVRGILFNQDTSRIILTSPILLRIGEEKNLWSMDVMGGEGSVGSYTLQFRFNSIREFSEWYQTSAIQSMLRELKTGKGSYNASLSMRRAAQ
jgi:hypothetical protein